MSISQDWWDAWWEADYSWEGLAKKRWRGWYVDAAWVQGEPFKPVPEDERVEGVEYRRATLQDYWRRTQKQIGLTDKDFFVDVEQQNWVPASLLLYYDGKVRFTVMHVPPEWYNGAATKKTSLGSLREASIKLLTFELSKPVQKTVFQDGWLVLGADNRLQWQGIVSLGFELNSSAVQGDTANGSTKISILATGAAFLGTVNFAEATFCSVVDFESAAFAGEAYFNDAQFWENTIFDRSLFTGYANFYRAKFHDGAGFYRTAFSKDAYFHASKFANQVSFFKAKFSGQGDFDSSRFSGPADFESASFGENSSFDLTTFADRVSFKDAFFSKGVFFHNAVFYRNAGFEHAAFSGYSNFINAIFVSQAIFSGKGNSVTSDSVNAEIKPKASDASVQVYQQDEAIMWTAQRSFPDADFENTIFMGAARFDNRDFHSATSFDGVEFYREAEFHDSSLHRGILFTQTTFDLALTPEKRTPDAVPKEALERLHEAAMLGKSKGERQDLNTWAKQRFAEIASKGDALKPETDPARSRYFERVEEGFRTLKHAMEDRRNRGQEARFFQLELRARRERRDEKFVPKWERIFSDVYRWTSNFGTSVGRPLFCLFLLTVIGFPCLYLLMGAGFTHWPTAAEFGDAMGYSFARIMPFGPWEDPKTCSMTGRMLAESVQPLCDPVRGLADLHYRGGTPFWLRFWGSVQSFTALVLVFLSGLAIRRRFQIN